MIFVFINIIIQDPCSEVRCHPYAKCRNGKCECLPDYYGDGYHVCKPRNYGKLKENDEALTRMDSLFVYRFIAGRLTIHTATLSKDMCACLYS